MIGMIKGLVGGLSGWQIYAVIGAGLLITATSAYAYHSWTVAGYEKELRVEEQKVANCVLDVAALQSNISALRGTISSQNAAVRAFREAGLVSATEADLAAVEALRASDAARARVLTSTASGPESMNTFMEDLF